MKKEDLLFWFFGAYLTILGIISFVNAFFDNGGAVPLWFSYITLLLIGVGILIRNAKLIAVQLNIIAIPVLIWNVDFFYQLFAKKSLLGLTDYLFYGGLTESFGNFVTLQHLYIIPVGLGFVYLLGLERTDLWKLSFLEIAIVFFLSLIFSVEGLNVNCAAESCIPFVHIQPPLYYLFWFLTFFVMAFLTNLLIAKTARKDNK